MSAPARRRARRATAAAPTSASTLADLEREALRSAMVSEGGSRQRVASRLGISVRTLYDKLRRYGLE